METEKKQSKNHIGIIETGTNYVGYNEDTDVITIELFKNTSCVIGKEIHNKLTKKTVSINFSLVSAGIESVEKTESKLQIRDKK